MNINYITLILTRHIKIYGRKLRLNHSTLLQPSSTHRCLSTTKSFPRNLFHYPKVFATKHTVFPSLLCCHHYTMTTTPSEEEQLHEWNLRLNKYAKLRYYQEAHNAFEKMKSQQVLPNASTYLIMFDMYCESNNANGANAIMEEVKNRNMKTQLTMMCAEISELMELREDRDKAINLHEHYLNSRRAGLNPFEPPQ